MDTRGWKQLQAPFPGTEVFDRFEKFFLAHNAPKDMALFSRTSPDFKHEIYLISPAAVNFALAGEVWEDATDADQHSWSVGIAATDVVKKFGITIGSDMEA
jgi:hypothetical protein